MTDTNVIDPAALNDLLEAVGGDREFLLELIDTYLQDSPVLLATIQQSLQEGSTEDLRRAAHSLKSNSANFGAARLAQLSKELEENAKRGELDGAAGQVAQILGEYQKVSQALLEIRT